MQLEIYSKKLQICKNSIKNFRRQPGIWNLVNIPPQMSIFTKRILVQMFFFNFYTDFVFKPIHSATSLSTTSVILSCYYGQFYFVPKKRPHIFFNKDPINAR